MIEFLKKFGAYLAVLCSVAPIFAQESGAVRFLSHYIPPQGGSYVAGCWGWTDTLSGREYALLGSYSGTSIVEITDPFNPIERDFVPGPSSTWHELQTHSHYAYVVTEAGGGVQIIDLSYLPDSVHLVQSFNFAIGDSNISTTHTNHIRDGYLYLNGSSHWRKGGVLIFSLADPENPVYQGSYQGHYFHDSFVRHDTIFGATINESGGGIDIVDVTNKTQPKFITRFNYPGGGTHNCATTEDGKYLLTTDEIGSTLKTLKIWSIADLNNISKVAEYQGDPNAIIHNVFVKGTTAFMSYYTAGLKIVDISNPHFPVEIGGYDTYTGSSSGYTGAWSTYPFFPSGKIIIGDMVSGLYVVDLAPNAPRTASAVTAYSDYTTPSTITLTWDDPITLISGAPLSGFTLHIYRDSVFLASVDSGVGMFVDTGLHLHQGYLYSLRVVTPTDSSSLSYTQGFAGGHAQPKAPTNFTLQSIDEGITLSWKNPSRQFDNSPLNDFSSVEIFRNNILLDSLVFSPSDTGISVSYTDSTRGYHTYSLRSRDNETPSHTSGFTESKFGYAGAILSTYSENFDNGRGTFYTNGTWDTTRSIAYDGNFSFTDSPVGNYPPSTTTFFTLPPIAVSANSVLSFYQIGIIGQGDFGFVEVSTDNMTFTRISVTNAVLFSQWQDFSADNGDWRLKTLDLSAYAGDTLIIRFLLISDAGITKDGWYIDNIRVSTAAGIKEIPQHSVPENFKLYQNYPNPFNPGTSIRFDIHHAGTIQLTIYDLLGRELTTLVNGEFAPGSYEAFWDGSSYPSGIYTYRLFQEGNTEIKTMLLLK